MAFGGIRNWRHCPWCNNNSHNCREVSSKLLSHSNCFSGLSPSATYSLPPSLSPSHSLCLSCVCASKWSRANEIIKHTPGCAQLWPWLWVWLNAILLFAHILSRSIRTCLHNNSIRPTTTTATTMRIMQGSQRNSVVLQGVVLGGRRQGSVLWKGGNEFEACRWILKYV